MRVISHRRIIEFGKKHPDSRGPLEVWFKIVRGTEYASLAEIKRSFPATDYVDGLFVFNNGGNKYRIIAAIHFNRGIVYILDILTHAEYDRNKWRE